MTSSYPLDCPLARFSKNFISKISFTPSEWTASVKSSSVVHWKIFWIFNYESLSKTPRKGQLYLVWTWSRGIFYSGCQYFLTFGEQSFRSCNSQKINLKNIHTSSFVRLHQPLHTVYQLQFTKENTLYFCNTCLLRAQGFNRTISVTNFFNTQTIFYPTDSIIFT